MSDEPPGPRPRNPLYRNPWLWAFLIGITVVSLTRPLLRRVPAAPPVLDRMPPFELVDAAGGRFGLAALEGSVWILAFVSATGAESACHGLIDSMTELSRRYDEAGIGEVRLLAIASAPSKEAPEPFEGFAEAGDLAPARWVPATGRPEETRRLAGFLLRTTGVASATAPSSVGALLPCRLFLIDGSGGVRGAYRDDTRGIDEIFHRAQHVVDATRGDPS